MLYLSKILNILDCYIEGLKTNWSLKIILKCSYVRNEKVLMIVNYPQYYFLSLSVGSVFSLYHAGVNIG